MIKRLTLMLVLCGAAISLTGCSTLLARVEAYDDEPFPATGISVKVIGIVAEELTPIVPVALPFMAVDLGVAFSTDVLCLPYDLYRASARSKRYRRLLAEEKRKKEARMKKVESMLQAEAGEGKPESGSRRTETGLPPEAHGAGGKKGDGDR